MVAKIAVGVLGLLVGWTVLQEREVHGPTATARPVGAPT
jgi:hypothetical protein